MPQGYSIEVYGEPECKNTVHELVYTWQDALSRLNIVVQQISEKYNIKPICLLRMSSEETCVSSGRVSTYSFTCRENRSVTIFICYFKENVSHQGQLIAQSS